MQVHQQWFMQSGMVSVVDLVRCRATPDLLPI